jgi:hypothetical protein
MASQTHLPLFVTEGEIAKRFGLPLDTVKMAIETLERHRGFPPKCPLFGNRRYWPAVLHFLNNYFGVAASSQTAPTRPQTPYIAARARTFRKNFAQGD